MFDVVTSLLPRKSMIWIRFRSETWKITTFPCALSLTSMCRSSRNPVSHKRRKSAFKRCSS